MGFRLPVVAPAFHERGGQDMSKGGHTFLFRTLTPPSFSDPRYI